MLENQQELNVLAYIKFLNINFIQIKELKKCAQKKTIEHFWTIAVKNLNFSILFWSINFAHSFSLDFLSRLRNEHKIDLSTLKFQ
jgi:hypothetical protein